MKTYEYREEILEELPRHGIVPTPTTRPALVMEYLNDLYRYELRKLRERLVRGDIQRRDYSTHVVALRKRYVLISIPIRFWTKQRAAVQGPRGEP